MALRMMSFYSFALTCALLLSSPVWGWRMLRQGRYRQGLRERLGAVSARLTAFVQSRPVVWVHAVSVGETLAATRLVRELEAALPGHAVVVSTTTPTGQQVARERFGVDRVFFFPLDFAFAVRAYFRALKPSLVVLMESELWPRMLVECERSGVPVAVVNARVSDRSLPRYMRLRALWKPLLKRISLLLAQSDEDARRWQQIGVPPERVIAAGNLKYDIRVPEASPLVSLLRRHLPADTRVLVCGSTHKGEESLLLPCWASWQGNNRVVLLAPRHPERVQEVEDIALTFGLPTLRLSVWRISPSRIAPDTVLLVDTVGELSALYALANVAFVGGSLVPHGGQNPLEPAQFGVPVVMGPSYENFRSMVDAMIAARAIRSVTSSNACETLRTLLYTEDDGGLGKRGRAFAASMSGATRRSVQRLLALLQERAR